MTTTADDLAALLGEARINLRVMREALQEIDANTPTESAVANSARTLTRAQHKTQEALCAIGQIARKALERTA